MDTPYCIDDMSGLGWKDAILRPLFMTIKTLSEMPYAKKTPGL